MGEALKYANNVYEKLLNEVKNEIKPLNRADSLLYSFFLQGFNAGINYSLNKINVSKKIKKKRIKDVMV